MSNTITVLNSELTESVIESLNILIDKDISPKVAFELLRITTILQKIVDDKNTIHNKLLKKYAVSDPNNENNFIVNDENIEEFKSKIAELNDIKHDIKLSKIKSIELDLIDRIKVKDMLNLNFLFDLDLPTIETIGGDII